MDMTVRHKRRDLRTAWLYARRLVWEFRWSFVVLGAIIVGGAVILHVTPQAELNGGRPDWMLSMYGSWMSLFAQPIFQRPDRLYQEVMQSTYPLLGVVLIGEGIVRFALLMVSRRGGEKEWMRVMASTYRDHVIICGLGHLGYRVLEQLLAQGRSVVVVEKRSDGRFNDAARATGVPVLISDMKDDSTLVDAGVAHAQAIVLATDDDLGNLEAALDSRRMNPHIKIAVRLFDQQMAGKLQDAFSFDAPFSPAALAAPAVAAMTLGCRVVGAFALAGVPHVAAEIQVSGDSKLVGMTIAELEAGRGVRVLARRPRDKETDLAPRGTTIFAGGDLVTLNVPVALVEEITSLAGATPAHS
jgi:voltage-gated potassium channel